MRSNFSHFLGELQEGGSHGRERLSLGELPDAKRCQDDSNDRRGSGPQVPNVLD